MRLHILGICGTFMSGIALLAKQRGDQVSGSDMNVYPPMSTQLSEQGIQLFEGYDPAHLDPAPDLVIVGNVIKRGNPAMEYVLNQKIPYISGPQWLFESVLYNRHVLAVAGTHGKTTTTSMLAWILEQNDQSTGFLIGGIPENFGVSARLGDAPYFVIEADEYDSAFFDKRAKFIHYHPKTLILNNLEYDHADIYPNLDAIKQQFHYLVRTVPGNGLIVTHATDPNLQDVLSKGCWTSTVTFSQQQGAWQAELMNADGSAFKVLHEGKEEGVVRWDLLGHHNVENALAATAAAHHAGVLAAQSCSALCEFKNVKRRMEMKNTINGVVIYDDFAHHPTAIATTLAGLRAKVGKARVIAVLEFGSYTMKSGVHKDKIEASLRLADKVFCKTTDNDWGLKEVLASFKQPTASFETVDDLVSAIAAQALAGDHIIVMSNSGFGGIHGKLAEALRSRGRSI